SSDVCSSDLPALEWTCYRIAPEGRRICPFRVLVVRIQASEILKTWAVRPPSGWAVCVADFVPYQTPSRAPPLFNHRFRRQAYGFGGSLLLLKGVNRSIGT